MPPALVVEVQRGSEAMKTILQIIHEAGGLVPGACISVVNEPWMRLVIEILPEPGPSALTIVSVAHYGVQNGDAMRDPEMLFEITQDEVGATVLWPFYFRNDYAGVEECSRRQDDSGNLHCRPSRTREFEEFAQMWDANLKAQGFLEAFQRRVRASRQ